jgi:hypothetical protein
LKAGGTAAVIDGRLVGNAARNGTRDSEGGAIYAGSDSSLKLVGSELSLNVASGSKLGGACGGAIMADRALVEVEDTLLLSNRVIDGGGGAIGVSGPGAVLNIGHSKITNNSAVSEVAGAAGGALYLRNGVSSEIVLSELTDNVATTLKVGSGAYGGALFISSGHRVNIDSCTVGRNAAEAPLDNSAAAGGGLSS